MNLFGDSMLFRIHRAALSSETGGGRALLGALQWKTADGEVAPGAYRQSYGVTWDSGVTSLIRRALERLHLSGLMYGVVEVVARGHEVVLHLAPKTMAHARWPQEKERLLRVMRAEFPKLTAGFAVRSAAPAAPSEASTGALRWARAWLPYPASLTGEHS